MPEFGFDLIDAKDYPVVHLKGTQWGMANNEHNARVMAKAEADYLNKLSELQQYIKGMYESQLIDNSPVEGEDPGRIFHEEWEKNIKVDARDLRYH